MLVCWVVCASVVLVLRSVVGGLCFFPVFLDRVLLEGGFVLPLVRFVDDLFEVFFGVAQLCFRVGVSAVMSEVVGGSVSSVDHVGCFEEVGVLRVVGLCPDVFAVEWVVVKL